MEGAHLSAHSRRFPIGVYITIGVGSKGPWPLDRDLQVNGQTSWLYPPIYLVGVFVGTWVIQLRDEVADV